MKWNGEGWKKKKKKNDPVCEEEMKRKRRGGGGQRMRARTREKKEEERMNDVKVSSARRNDKTRCTAKARKERTRSSSRK